MTKKNEKLKRKKVLIILHWDLKRGLKKWATSVWRSSVTRMPTTASMANKYCIVLYSTALYCIVLYSIELHPVVRDMQRVGPHAVSLQREEGAEGGCKRRVQGRKQREGAEGGRTCL